jgi:L-lysine 2,3-aminomutase
LLAKNGAQRPLLHRLAPVKHPAIVRLDARAMVAIPLRFQKEVAGSVPHVQEASEHTAFDVVKAGLALRGLENEAGEIGSQIRENFGLVNVNRRCEDHATASMLVWFAIH